MVPGCEYQSHFPVPQDRGLSRLQSLGSSPENRKQELAEHQLLQPKTFTTGKAGPAWGATPSLATVAIAADHVPDAVGPSRGQMEKDICS